ncbi:uncharacterized protein Z520_01473 [Fonsecaea multimorphosa CBS 102226]|uniref:Transcriptional regulator n=1 Tax=Fonsecaea multimorphosa CBS 102226 TaxID=1442371 RepID=A0A0D2J0W2_9EURO|nr:uncharacterized protein Z520_01473 [Fonsecaea multimorphosa CBS 102226]KIY03007.1 hypothetical protein Z520_01473 [Fonsecaea multimorphosa CBS 102226]OAL30836.1 hypothetical protein AYO22_01456 [Fonsecaea multimorphosa]
MSVSDSDLSEASTTPAPPDHELEKSLRREVVKAQRDGIEFSNNYIRGASEAKLGLTKGFYKNHKEWAQRSRDIIADQLTIPSETHSSPAKPKEPKKAIAKRKSSQKESAPHKRQKAAAKSDDDASDDLSSPLSDLDSEAGQEKQKTKQRKATQKPRPTKSKSSKSNGRKVADSDEDEQAEQANGTPAEESSNEGETTVANAEDGSDSEMSVLLDEVPPQKKSRKRKDSARQKSKKPASKSATKPKADADTDPELAEIKRLQGWLVKCGIRKLWGKELKPYETSKAKIKHLKEMLADVGMTGRYSLEKANQIKEARELAADIEAVQEGAERWGAAQDEDGARVEKGTDSSRPARRLVRGARNYDFLSSDGEETD